MTLKKISDWVLVHGICLHPAHEDEPFAHAWVENPSEAIVVQGLLVDGERVFAEMPLAMFYLSYRPQRLTRYSVEEAARLNHETNHYGPWEEAYEQLCMPGERRPRSAS